jgi:hypothetical protein
MKSIQFNALHFLSSHTFLISSPSKRNKLPIISSGDARDFNFRPQTAFIHYPHSMLSDYFGAISIVLIRHKHTRHFVESTMLR